MFIIVNALINREENYCLSTLNPVSITFPGVFNFQKGFFDQNLVRWNCTPTMQPEGACWKLECVRSSWHPTPFFVVLLQWRTFDGCTMASGLIAIMACCDSFSNGISKVLWPLVGFLVGLFLGMTKYTTAWPARNVVVIDSGLLKQKEIWELYGFTCSLFVWLGTNSH